MPTRYNALVPHIAPLCCPSTCPSNDRINFFESKISLHSAQIGLKKLFGDLVTSQIYNEANLNTKQHVHLLRVFSHNKLLTHWSKCAEVIHNTDLPTGAKNWHSNKNSNCPSSTPTNNHHDANVVSHMIIGEITPLIAQNQINNLHTTLYKTHGQTHSSQLYQHPRLIIEQTQN